MYKGPDDDPNAPWTERVDVPQDLPMLKKPKKFEFQFLEDDQWYEQLNEICVQMLNYGDFEEIDENTVHHSTA